MQNTKVDSILYVEDEKSVQEELSEFLENFCNKLYIASDGLEGLEIFQRCNPNIILTDIKMPRMNGIDMAKEIFKQNPSKHMIFMTAFTDLEYLQNAIELHADGYITKPVDLDKLEDLLKKSIQVENINRELDRKTKHELKKKAELETILSTTVDGLAILDLNGNFLYANYAYESMIEYSLKELKKINVLDLSIQDECQSTKEALQKVIKDGYIDHFQKKCMTKSNKKIVLDISFALMPDKHRILISTKDITTEFNSKKKIQEYVNIIDENIITSNTDLDGTITYVSNAFCKISGYTKDELIGKNHNITKDPDTPKDLYVELWETIVKNQIWTGEFKNKNKNGENYWVYSKIYPTFNENEEKVGYTSIGHDITNLKKVEELALIDALTGAYNRHNFNENIDRYIQSAKRDDKLISFAMFDVDFFKLYNDTYGHIEGDNALKQIASSIKKLLHRADDNLYRIGGEEFGVLFKSNSKKNAIIYANKFLDVVSNLKLIHEKSSASKYISISIGLVSKSAREIESSEALYKEADELLYRAKAQGRNRLVYNKD